LKMNNLQLKLLSVMKPHSVNQEILIDMTWEFGERASLRLALSNGPRCFPPPHLMTETDPVSEMLCSLFF
jgi:hypothetical protein